MAPTEKTSVSRDLSEHAAVTTLTAQCCPHVAAWNANARPMSNKPSLHDVRRSMAGRPEGRRQTLLIRRTDIPRIQPSRRIRSSTTPGPGTASTIRPRYPKVQSRQDAGGARRDRTDDLMLAKHALSQLSYGPVTRTTVRCVVGLGRLELPTSRLSGVRSNQLSYRPAFRRPCLPASPPGKRVHDQTCGPLVRRRKRNEDGEFRPVWPIDHRPLCSKAFRKAKRRSTGLDP
jgi:hypothetical protein